MTCRFKKGFTICKTLEKSEGAYRYLIKEGTQEKQLYSIFLKTQQEQMILLNYLKKLQNLQGEHLVRVYKFAGFEPSPSVSGYNVQIITDHFKCNVWDHLRRRAERQMELTPRETFLIVNNHIQFLNTLLTITDNKLFAYLVQLLDDELEIMTLNDTFLARMSLLPVLSKIKDFKWGSLPDLPEVKLEELITKLNQMFFRKICGIMPVKKKLSELTTYITAALADKGAWDDVFKVPSDLFYIITDLLNTNNENAIEKVKSLTEHLNKEYFQNAIELIIEDPPQPNTNNSEKTLRITSDDNFFKLLYNLRLDHMIELYYPDKISNTPRKEIKTENIENFIIQGTDVSVLIFYEIGKLNFSSLKKLALQACGVTADSLSIVLRWEALQNLETLDFNSLQSSQNLIGSVGCARLACCEFLKNLKQLNLSYCKVDDAGLGCLSESNFLTNLESLDLSNNKLITKAGLKLLNKSEKLQKLHTLNLMSNEIGNEGLEELLCDCLFPKKYKSLNICENKITKEGLELIALSEQCQELESLYLDANDLSKAEDWISPTKLTKLKKLSCQFCGLKDESLLGLLTLIEPQNLTYLDVSYNDNIELKMKDLSFMENLEELLIESTRVESDLFDNLAATGKSYKLQKISLRKAFYNRLFEIMSVEKIFPRMKNISLSRSSNFQSILFFTYYPFAEWSVNLQSFTLFSAPINLMLLRSDLYQSLYFNGLIELSLWGVHHNGNNVLVQILKSDKFKNLVTLDMTSCLIDDKSFNYLGKVDSLPKVKTIKLLANCMSFKSIRKFIQSKLFTQLEVFDIRSNNKLKDKHKQYLSRYAEKYNPKLAFEV